MKWKDCWLILLCACVLVGQTMYCKAGQRKKVGVVLSGGGAKGMAHIKALEVIEQAGIPIDYIAGTSMGSIVGGLYAIGYTPQQLDSMVKEQDWTFMLTDKVKTSAMSLNERKDAEKYLLSLSFSNNLKESVAGGLVKGENLSYLFSDLTVGYHDSIDFNKLSIPFACVATNAVDGKPVVFHSGVLSTAMRASMAIPAVFTPVRQDSLILVDGGLVNNYPADVVKEMGADIIIGVDVESELKTADQLTGVSEILMQIIDLATKANHEENVAMTDVYIKVNVKGYSSASFTATAIDTLMQRGKEAAMAQWDALLALKEKIGIPEDFVPAPHGPYTPLSNYKTLYVSDITFSNIDENDKKWLMKKCKLQPGNMITTKQIEDALYQLRGNQSYSNVSYTLKETPQGYQLNFNLEEKHNKYISLGIRFDSEEIASVIAKASTDLNTRVPSQLTLTGRLGKRYAGRVDYTLEPAQQRKFNFSYMFQYNDINIYDKGDRAYNTTYHYHLAEIGLSDVWYRNLLFGVGLRYEYYKYKDFLFKKTGIESTLEAESEHFLSYFARLEYNTYDKCYFPSKGNNLELYGSVYTDNFVQYDDHAPFAAVTASWAGVIPLAERFTLIPSLYGRVLIGEGFPYALQNAIGGEVYGLYLNQQLPFAGVNNAEMVDNAFVAASLKLRHRMGSIHYLTLNLNYGITESSLYRITQGEHLFGVSLGYGMDSFFGPLEFSLGYSTRCEKSSCFLNLGYYF